MVCVPSLSAVAPILSATPITNTGMASTKNEARVVNRSKRRYWRMAPNAPSATPPREPMRVAISRSRVETPTRRPKSSLTSSPSMVLPRSPWTTPSAQCPNRDRIGVSGFML